MTALVTGGAGGAGGVFGGFAAPPEPEEPDEPELDGDATALPPPANGSLLSKSENDSSCPVPAGGLTAETSSAVGSDEEVVGVEVGVDVPESVGAATGVV